MSTSQGRVSQSAEQTACCSRTFGAAVTDKGQVREAIVSFAERAAEKIRAAGQVCGAVQVFIMTDRFDTQAAQHSGPGSTTFMTPIADSRVIVDAALRISERLRRDGFAWRKAGMLLLDLSPATDVIPSLFAPTSAGGERLMGAVDRINERYSRSAIGLGLAARAAGWRMRQERLSPRFTTRWQEIPKARLGVSKPEPLETGLSALVVVGDHGVAAEVPSARRSPNRRRPLSAG